LSKKGRFMTTRFTICAALLLPLLLAACHARTRYPDPTAGRHNADYSLIFGRIQRVPAADPAQPPLWMIRYGSTGSDKYGGKLNLTPPAKLTGFSGGELVEITGGIHPEYSHPDFPGTWYQINSIRLWPAYHEP
jgi:hypothetical protein